MMVDCGVCQGGDDGVTKLQHSADMTAFILL